MPIRRARINLRRLLRRVFRQDDPPERIARGVAAGFFAAAFPLPGFQIPLSLLMAFLARGNAAVAVLPQFLSNAGSMVPLAFLQFKIGSWLWPSRAAEVNQALKGLEQAFAALSWSSPAQSLDEFFAALGRLGLDGLGPLFIGVLVSGALLAAASYPLTVVAVWTWRARRRRRRVAKGLAAPPLPPFVLDPAPCPQLGREEAIGRYALRAEAFLEAQSVKLLVDGRQAFPAMLSAIAQARDTVDLETYILQSDRTGERFAQALIAAAGRGARVRVLFDAVGSLTLSASYVQRLLAGGVAVAVFRPLLVVPPSMALHRRDHRKVLVVDGRLAFTGGLNIADDCAPREEGGGGWRDTHMRLDGVQPAREFLALFEDTWRKAKPYPAPAGGRAAAPEAPAGHAGTPVADRVAVQVLSNQEFRQRRRIRRAHMYAINRARHYVLIENAYFIPDRGVRRALARAVRRGVKVAVALAQRSDVEIAAMASRALYGDLLASGVRLFEWPHAMLHAKTAVIDDAWAIVGTYNFDHRSLMHNLEVAVVVADPVFARALRDQTLADLGQSRELTLAQHESRPWRRMLLESAASQLRYWL